MSSGYFGPNMGEIMRKAIIGIFGAAVIAAGVMFAIGQKAPEDSEPGWGKRGGHHRGIERAFRALSLTDEQKTRVKELHTASRENLTPVLDALRANREKMEALTANGAFDEAQVTALANEQAALSARLIVEKQRVKSQMFALLTDEQKAKFAEMKTKHEQRRKGFMAGVDKKISE